MLVRGSLCLPPVPGESCLGWTLGPLAPPRTRTFSYNNAVLPFYPQGSLISRENKALQWTSGDFWSPPILTCHRSAGPNNPQNRTHNAAKAHLLISIANNNSWESVFKWRQELMGKQVHGRQAEVITGHLKMEQLENNILQLLVHHLWTDYKSPPKLNQENKSRKIQGSSSYLKIVSFSKEQI